MPGIPEGEEEGVSDEELGQVGLVAEPVELQLPVRQVVRVQDHVAGEEPGHVLQTVLRNHNFLPKRNRNRNLITDLGGNGTRTVINYGSGTVIKWNHKSSHRHSIKLCTAFNFLHSTFFSLTFFKKLDASY
jgi:hypothetical protein